jgi:hypothetical protein
MRGERLLQIVVGGAVLIAIAVALILTRSGCSAVSRSTLDAIEKGLNTQGPLSSGQAIREDQWWYVAAKLADGETGVWAMDDGTYHEGSGTILSANPIARQVSHWGTEQAAKRLGVTATGATDAAACFSP